MKLHPIKANEDFQAEVLASVNRALEGGVSAKQLIDYLDHVILRQLVGVNQQQLQAELDDMESEEETNDSAECAQEQD